MTVQNALRFGLGSLVLILILLPFLLPVPDTLWRLLALRQLGGQLHVFLFLALTLFLYRHGPLAGRWLAVAIVAVLMGAAVEVIQGLLARHARWQDFGLDLVGIGAGLGWIRWQVNRSWPWLAFAVLMLLLVPWQLRNLPGDIMARRNAVAIFPELADFDDPRQVRLWAGINGGICSLISTGQNPGGVLRLDGGPPHPYPGAEMNGFPRDWSAYPYLTLSIRLVNGPRDTVRVGVRVDDYRGRRSENWAVQGLDVTHQWQRITLDLRNLRKQVPAEPLRWHDMDSMLLFLPQPKGPTAVEFDDIFLSSLDPG